MNVKTNTKEIFTVIIPQESILSANMTEDIKKLAHYSTDEVPNLILNMSEVKELDAEAAHEIAGLQQGFYDRNRSFVICCLAPGPEAVIEKEELTERMNITPTESEAADILQMEAIERELFNDLDEDERPE